jgi:hypothetical protein
LFEKSLIHLKTKLARGWWCTPVIQATWEAEVKRITVPGQTREIVLEIPFPK